ncbi:hypothetical protein BKP44_12615 [Formosa algae]|nr:hypothetical protein AST99_00710 [Formosa algae]PNW27460.1 hypothetical protein BKP44_12615 [Formosa algae]
MVTDYLIVFRPVNREITNSTKNIKNNIFAIPAAPAAIPPNPKMAATIAKITNVTVQRSIIYGFKWLILN